MAHATDIITMTAAEFEAFALRPENRDRKLEFIGGRVIEVVSNAKSSYIALEIGAEIRHYLKRTGIGFATTADGGYAVGDDRLIPDVGVALFRDGAELREVAYNMGLSLAVEVISPTDSMADAVDKVYAYSQNGVAVWLIDPFQETVTVYVPGQSLIRLGKGDVLKGEPILPDFALPLTDLFKWPTPPTE